MVGYGDPTESCTRGDSFDTNLKHQVREKGTNIFLALLLGRRKRFWRGRLIHLKLVLRYLCDIPIETTYYHLSVLIWCSQEKIRLRLRFGSRQRLNDV